MSLTESTRTGSARGLATGFGASSDRNPGPNVAERSVTLVLCKGRLLGPSLEVLARAGVDVPADIEEDRRVIVPVGDDLRILFSRPDDAPTYVGRGAADLGIVGSDSILEAGADVVELADLGVAACRMAFAGRPGADLSARRLVVASRYANFTRAVLAERGMDAEVLPMRGSVELAVVTGAADVILDLVATGRTLAENGMVILDVVRDISARLIANAAALRTGVPGVLRLANKIMAGTAATGATAAGAVPLGRASA